MNKTKIISWIIGLVIGLSIVGLISTVRAYDWFDTVWKYDYAWISLPNGDCVEGKVDQWRDYEDGDQVQVTIDGKTYLTDTTRCVLVKY